jgi:hypothetical protein
MFAAAGDVQQSKVDVAWLVGYRGAAASVGSASWEAAQEASSLSASAVGHDRPVTASDRPFAHVATDSVSASHWANVCAPRRPGP